jgi:outer membrane protein assembly factor BamB
VDGGPRSFHGDPLLYEGTLFISTDHGCEGSYVYAFEQQTGKLRWKYRANGPSTGFVRFGNAIIFGTREDEWISVAMDSGNANWTFRDASPDPQCEIRTSPVADGRNVFFVTHDSAIFALNGAGRKIWSRRPSSAVTTSLFLYKDVLYFGTADGHIHGLDPANGGPLTHLTTRAIPKGRFAWDSRGGVETEYVFGIDKKGGQSRGVLLKFTDEFDRLLWAQLAEREWTSEQPHVWKDWIIAGNCKGDIVGYKADSGEPAWTDHVKGCIRSLGHDDSTVYIGVQEGTVYAYQPAGH